MFFDKWQALFEPVNKRILNFILQTKEVPPSSSLNGLEKVLTKLVQQLGIDAQEASTPLEQKIATIDEILGFVLHGDQERAKEAICGIFKYTSQVKVTLSFISKYIVLV